MIENDSVEKSTKQLVHYECSQCNYVTRKKTDYSKHLTTDKHLKTINTVEKIKHDVAKSTIVDKHYNCVCGNVYKYDSGYYRHKKTCAFIPPEQPKSDTDLYAIIHLLIKENQEIRNLVLTQNNTLVDQNKTLTELVKNQQSSTNNSHNNTNSHNNYNINMFLSEKCKDAKNMSEFIETLKTKVDMFQIEENGYVNGISKLFIDELKSMEVTERPLHCTDERRSTFYVHNNDAWNKDDDLKDTKKAISHVSHTNLKQCIDWSTNVPKGGSQREDHINRSIRLCKEAHKSGQDDKVEKIIRNISKEIPLNKQVISGVLV